MDKLKVIISNNQKAVKIPTGIRLLLRKCCHAVLRTEDLHDHFEVSVAFVDDETIREYNQKYLGRDRATDVLSFPTRGDQKGDDFDVNTETGAKMLGDIMISAPMVYAQAARFGHSIQREFGYLTVHSMLHLLGYDHVDGGLNAIQMREKEEAVLALLGLQRDISYVTYNDEEK